jgi:pimeloyl-ACP methyl ester carboxylesterase
MLVIAPLHGNGTMIRDFTVSGLVELLASRTRGVCFDGLGFGYNQWPRSSIWIATTQAGLFVNALNELGMRNPVVLSHSWGTLVAVALALRTDYPIRGLVLASGYYLPTSRWDVWIMSGPPMPVLGDLGRYTVAPIISWGHSTETDSQAVRAPFCPPKVLKQVPIFLIGPA